MQKLHFEKNDFLVIIFENDYDWGGGEFDDWDEWVHSSKSCCEKTFWQNWFPSFNYGRNLIYIYGVLRNLSFVQRRSLKALLLAVANDLENFIRNCLRKYH